MRRILALSGGGVRGIIEIAFLEAIEAVYQSRRGPDSRLSDVFDLVGGTSTGALIAASLSLGKSASEIADFYLNRAGNVFGKPRSWAFGLAPRYPAELLETEIRAEVGDVRLGDPDIRTLLAIVMKRLDTGSPWIVSNVPTAPFYDNPPDGSFLGNRHYLLGRILRASTAAPTYFRQETLDIACGVPPGVFVDGGVSPFNDPSLALLMLARMKAFGLCWPMGTEELFVLSIATGRWRRRVPPERAAHLGPLSLARDALTGLVSDAESHSVTLMEWIGQSRAPVDINAEIGTLGDDHAFGEPPFSYLRLDVPLEATTLEAIGIARSEKQLEAFRRMDDPRIIQPLYELAREVCAECYDLERLLP